MRLNTLKPAEGAKQTRKRVGRGIGSGSGSTSGRGDKGQLSRSGGGTKPGFEGGQMPMQRRLPKFGFHSRKAAVTAEIRLHELAMVDGDIIDLESLKKADVISNNIQFAKVMLSGKLDKAVVLKGIGVTKGARAAIEAVGGRVEE